jgi:hypothetical protein
MQFDDRVYCSLAPDKKYNGSDKEGYETSRGVLEDSMYKDLL